MKPAGYHFLLDLGDVDPQRLDDPDFIRRAMHSAIERAELTLLGEIEHRFEPQGVTAIALLAESHLSIHTWPESGYAAADLFTCGERAPAERACKLLIEIFEPRDVHLHVMFRGVRLAEGHEPIPVVVRSKRSA
ncbi:MAG: adenosylmethionine decarboxylase [Myxococcales bacterium]|nr:adenosylmethionine decarboxylase [Myxococcales bacterium]